VPLATDTTPSVNPRLPTRRRMAEPVAPARSQCAIRPEDRARRAGGPQDRALYDCACGSTFHAPVTASVRCPRCGDAQAW
jgi:hypothetical protein